MNREEKNIYVTHNKSPYTVSYSFKLKKSQSWISLFISFLKHINWTTKLESPLAHDRSYTSPYKYVVRNTIVSFILSFNKACLPPQPSAVADNPPENSRSASLCLSLQLSLSLSVITLLSCRNSARVCRDTRYRLLNRVLGLPDWNPCFKIPNCSLKLL